jgi:hypothetical protein
VSEQVELYGTLTGEHEAVQLDEPDSPSQAEVVPMPTRTERERRAR